MFFELGNYDLVLLVLGVASLGAVVLPRVLSGHPLSFPVIYLLYGMLVFWLGPFEFDVEQDTAVVERVSEATVIIALTGLGLKIDRPFGWRNWSVTWRLLAVTMPLTIAAGALLGWGILGWPLASALLLGAVIAPTDPVLAHDVQPEGPLRGQGEGRVRFALSSEAGLNDGLAFPFTNLAIAVALAGVGGDVLAEWFGVAVVLKIVVGLAVGWLFGRGVAWLVFSGTVGESRVAETAEGIVALAITLLAYGAAELAQGYGFIAVFVAAVTIREYERDHGYHEVLHRFADQAERLLIAVFLVLLGGALVSGLLDALSWQLALVAAVLIFVVRPAAGWLGLAGAAESRPSRAIISFYGIRGVGSFYYLSHALEEAEFARTAELWALVGAVVVGSMVVHGLSANPVMGRFDEWREQRVT